MFLVCTLKITINAWKPWNAVIGCFNMFLLFENMVKIPFMPHSGPFIAEQFSTLTANPGMDAKLFMTWYMGSRLETIEKLNTKIDVKYWKFTC